MANYGGTYSTDQTVNDGDSFTSDIVINGASTFTISAGATVTCANGQDVIVGSGTTGTLYCVGTEAQPIILKAANSDPTFNTLTYFGTIAVSGSTVNVQYTKFQSWAIPINSLANDLAVINVTVNHIWCDSCAVAVSESASHTNARSYTIQNVLITFCTGISSSGVIILDLDNVASTTTWTRIFSFCSGQSGLFLASTQNGTNITEVVNIGGTAFFATTSAASTLINVTDCYSGFVTVSHFIPGANFNLNLSKCVLYNTYSGHAISMAQATSTLNSSKNDITFSGCASQSVNYGLTQSAGTLNSDYDYIAGCNHRPIEIVNTANQFNGTITQTNQRATPNKPLTATVTGTSGLGDNGITIAFDCDEGSAGSRIHGLGFVRYGTASGVYTMSTIKKEASDPIQLGKYWTGWDTTFTFKQTGHSIALVNLKKGTTYYYQACFVDPLGRVGVSSEGTFTTTSTDIAASNVSATDYSISQTESTTITADITGGTPDLVLCDINGKSFEMTDVGGGVWSVTLLGSQIGVCTGETISVVPCKDGSPAICDTAASTMEVTASANKTALLISQVSTSLTGDGITNTVTLTNEKTLSGVNGTIRTDITISSTDGNGNSDVDKIRNSLIANATSWSGVGAVTDVYEWALPLVSATEVQVFTRINHT